MVLLRQRRGHAGGDIAINGTANLTGTIIAREQIRMAGNVTLQGSAIEVPVYSCDLAYIRRTK